MKRIIVVAAVVAVCAIVFSGCALRVTHNDQTVWSANVQPQTQASISPSGPALPTKGYPIGWVPGPFETPNTLNCWVTLFEGSAPVKQIPDPATGGWKYSRPAWGEGRYYVKAGYGDRTWGYTWYMLPRNTYFRGAMQCEDGTDLRGGSGWTSVKFFSFRTGPHPTAKKFTKNTPTQQRLEAGWKARLPFEDRSSGGQLLIGAVFDARMGQPAADAVTSRIYRR